MQTSKVAHEYGAVCHLPDNEAGSFNFSNFKVTETAATKNVCFLKPDIAVSHPESKTDCCDLDNPMGAAKKRIREVTPSRNYRKARRQSFGDGFFEVAETGVYHISIDKEDNEIRSWVCSPLYILAETRDSFSNEWGRLLEWKDSDGQTHHWAMPMALLQGDGLSVREELARQGLTIGATSKAKGHLASYLQTWKTEKRARCVDRLGWHNGIYVLPNDAIGQAKEVIVFQNKGYLEPAFSQSGTVVDWKKHVASLAAGNSRMIFAICTAFASTLIEIIDMESGGFHLRGSSSSGKTTALHLAASVYGNPCQYIRLWRTTGNGLEGLAALHNDSLLILDELSQADPREAGDAAYLLANGQGKTRANRNGTAQRAAFWRSFFLSAGEETLTTVMKKAGKKTNAGQEIRLADIEIDAGRNMGGFETIHQYATPAELALKLKDNAGKYYGMVGLEWIRKIVLMRDEMPQKLKEGIERFMDECITKGISGQATRVARRFALVAVAGEVATEIGLTGWLEGEAGKATMKCFNAWLENFGTVNREETAILEQIKGFIEANGNSRFEDNGSATETKILNRVEAFRTLSDGTEEYMLFPKAFAEICAGFDQKTVIRILQKHEWMKKASDGKNTHKARIASLGKPTRVYILTGKMWD